MNSEKSSLKSQPVYGLILDCQISDISKKIYQRLLLFHFILIGVVL